MFTTCMSLSVAVLMVRTLNIWIIIKCIMPDFDYIRKELLKNGVNKKLLWTEYLEECSQNGDDALMYSQFCYYIQQNEQKSRATMHIPRKAGQQIEVDWAGDPAKIIDPDTGEITEAWIFVGVMTYSQYAFVEAFINEQQKSWITAHVHMYEFFGGVTPILVSDNAPTATNRKQSDKYESVLIKSYEELAQHYNTAIIPARVRAPKDKPTLPIVLINCCNPLTGRYAACTGINTESAQAKALIVIIPRDGIQSIMIKS